MTVTYFKRYRMEIRLDAIRSDVAATCQMPEGFSLLPWDASLLAAHAEVKFQSFRHELDAQVFPCLSDPDGCRQLMLEIAGRSNFVPEATWLAVRNNEFDGLQPCGTVQGLQTSNREGSIQNLGVHPDCRGQGLGRTLLLAALRGFASIGCRYAHLEVTVQNTDAIRLYERFGFRRVETLYKVADVQYT